MPDCSYCRPRGIGRCHNIPLAASIAHISGQKLIRASLTVLRGTFVFNHGETGMGDMGSKDKGKREPQKKAQLTPKEKRKLK
jgi:hypothetical protein